MTLLHAARDLLLPARCAGCERPGSWFCQRCIDECEPVEVEVAPDLVVCGAGAFEGALRDAIVRFKYSSERGLAAELGALVARQAARTMLGNPIDAVVPVSLHRARRTERGYDQAELLAAVVAAAIGAPLAPLLRRARRARPQVELDRVERLRNMRGAFVAPNGALRGLRVALVDDVATTGATLAAAAAACRAAGARAVRGAVVAVDR